MLPGGPFDVYYVTSNTYSVFPQLVVKNDYRLQENIKGGANYSVMTGPTIFKCLGAFIWNPKIIFKQKPQYSMLFFEYPVLLHYQLKITHLGKCVSGIQQEI